MHVFFLLPSSTVLPHHGHHLPQNLGIGAVNGLIGLVPVSYTHLSRTVICNRDIDIASFLFPANVDFRSRRCILDGIVNNVNPLLRIKQQFAQAAMRQRGIVSEDAGILPRSDKARAAYYLTAKTKDPGELKVNLWGKSSVILAMQASKSPAGPASVRWVC